MRPEITDLMQSRVGQGRAQDSHRLAVKGSADLCRLGRSAPW